MAEAIVRAFEDDKVLQVNLITLGSKLLDVYETVFKDIGVHLPVRSGNRERDHQRRTYLNTDIMSNLLTTCDMLQGTKTLKGGPLATKDRSRRHLKQVVFDLQHKVPEKMSDKEALRDVLAESLTRQLKHWPDGV